MLVPPEILKIVTNTGGKLLFRALARNMAPMTNHHDSTLRLKLHLFVVSTLWYSGEDNTIKRHIDIPTIYLQLETVRKIATNNGTHTTNINVENLPTSATHEPNYSIIPDNEVHPSMTTYPSTTNDTAVLTSRKPS